MTNRELAELWDLLGIPASYGTDRCRTRQFEPPKTKLIEITSVPAGQVVRLKKDAAAAWQRMRAAATSQHVVLLPLSGFRSIARQAEIIRAKLAAGQPLDQILRVNAAPGYSEHHTGRALDLGTPGDPPFEESFAHTPAFAWLAQNASAFGFALSYPRDNPQGIVYEPWHWCWHA